MRNTILFGGTNDDRKEVRLVIAVFVESKGRDNTK